LHDEKKAGYHIVTPDHDEYIEELRVSNPDLKDIVAAKGLNDRPGKIGRAVIHSFTTVALTDSGNLFDSAKLEQWIHNASVLEGQRMPAGPVVVKVVGGEDVVVRPPAPADLGGDPARDAAAAAAALALVPKSLGLSPPVRARGDATPEIGPVASQVNPKMPRIDDPNKSSKVVPASLAPVPVMGKAQRVVGPQGMWILDEPIVGGEVGDEVCVPESFPRLGSRGLVLLNGEEAVIKFVGHGCDVDTYSKERSAYLNTDRRILPPHSGENTSVPQVVSEMSVQEYPFPFPLEGGRHASWFLDTAVSSVGGSFLARHHRWVSTSGVRPTTPLVYEHETLSTGLDLGATYDRLNLKNSVMVEWFLRRIMLQESSVSENPTEPSFEGARHFMGFGERKGGALVAPALQSHVASELGKEAAILKEKRKAREARSTKPKGRGKGDLAAASDKG
jgi:hypothetical protein